MKNEEIGIGLGVGLGAVIGATLAVFAGNEALWITGCMALGFGIGISCSRTKKIKL
ncbi:hypothetical protein KFE98_05455 [bacterium SCSIO 12741]|nr:hypothetical protein KFE98_05455 [bacterium SCSIO 12741]